MKIKNFCHPDEQMSKVGRHNWSVSRLITLAKSLPVMDIPLDHLFIFYKYDSLSLRELVGHMKSVNDADLKYPIILDEDGEVMDGRHRIMKALLTGKKTIKAVRFEENPSPCSVDDD
jgi:hypothetical protein